LKKLILALAISLFATLAFANPTVTAKQAVSNTGKATTYTSTVLLEPIPGWQLGGSVIATSPEAPATNGYAALLNTYLGNLYNNASVTMTGVGSSKQLQLGDYFGYGWYSVVPNWDLNLDGGYYTYWYDQSGKAFDPLNTTFSASATVKYHF
jgi:hypothetical protein